jgi:hypothetical protein
MAANRVFTSQFRQSIVERVLKGQSVGVLSQEFNIGRSVLYRWCDSYRREGVAGIGLCCINRRVVVWSRSPRILVHVQAPSFPSGYHSGVRSLVLQVWDKLPGSGGDDAGTRRRRGSVHDHALGFIATRLSLRSGSAGTRGTVRPRGEWTRRM